MDRLLADTRVFFTLLLAVLAVERLWEWRRSAANTRELLRRGGRETGRAHHPLLILAHSACFLAPGLEVWLLGRSFRWWLAAPSLVLVALALVLRLWAIRSLANRWSMRVVVITGTLPVVRGPYRFIRHPADLATGIETFALPLVHSAFFSSLLVGTLEAAVLAERIRVEERLWRQVSSYKAGMERMPRFFPRR